MIHRRGLKPPRPHPVQISGAAHQPVDSQRTTCEGAFNGEQFPLKEGKRRDDPYHKGNERLYVYPLLDIDLSLNATLLDGSE